MANKFDSVRAEIMEKVSELFTEMEYDVLQTGTQELCIPIIGKEDEEGYLVVTFKIPKGSRDGDVYDGYEMAEDFRLKQEAKAEKAKAAAEAKAKKIAKDKAAREAKAAAKAAAKANEI